MVNSEWLRAFVAFAERMNFTHAAEALHISQPALHVQIRKLSDSIGSPLYVRRGRVLSLTTEGRCLLAFGREQVERNEAFLADIRHGARSDVVTLTAGEGTFLYLLGDAVGSYQSKPGTKLRILARDREQALEALQLGEAHLAVTVMDEVPDAFVAKPVARVGSAVVLPKGHRLASRHTVSIHDLADEPVIVPAEGRPQRAALAKAWSDAGVLLKPAVEVNGWELMLHFARLGLGVAIVNDFCKEPPGTVMKPLRGLPRIHYQLLKLRGRVHSHAVTTLEKAILDHT
jgi:DNA-binding transcriptional LysR family regulator